MDFITRGACSVWSSVRASEALPLLANLSKNITINKFPRTISWTLFTRYLIYITNNVVAAYSFQALINKNISMLSLIPHNWKKTSALAQLLSEKIIKAPGACFLPNAQIVCWIPTLFTVLQITLDIFNLYSDEKYPLVKQLRNLCEQIAGKLNALFFAQMALYSFRNVGSWDKAEEAVVYYAGSFIAGLAASRFFYSIRGLTNRDLESIIVISYALRLFGVESPPNTRGTVQNEFTETDAKRALISCITIPFLFAKYPVHRSAFYLALGALNSYSALKSAMPSANYSD